MSKHRAADTVTRRGQSSVVLGSIAAPPSTCAACHAALPREGLVWC
jgi:hypothetical protein